MLHAQRGCDVIGQKSVFPEPALLNTYDNHDMNTLRLGTIVLLIAASCSASAVVTCSEPGSTQTVYNGTCSVSNVTGTLSYEGFTSAHVQGNQLQFEALAEALSFPGTPYPANYSGPALYPMSASASWNDSFVLPSSAPGDLLDITITGGGLNHPAAVYAGPLSYPETDFCDAHYTGNPACTLNATLPASQLASVQLIGSDSVSPQGPCPLGLGTGCDRSANASLFEDVTISRFLADGSTPDPFTSAPEPGTQGIVLAALVAIAGVMRARRARLTT